ncbi:MAG: HAD-IA family hydrolase [Armatimonadetes bacterium]|nr:HAD-IA family hydrolase [Anaerolineae bacterium]
MIKAVLLDLDETLLRNPNQGFVGRYLELVDEFFTQRWGQPISKPLFDSVRMMMTSVRDMQHSNAHLAFETIQQTTGDSLADIEAALDDFYRSFLHYPALQSFTQPIPGAPDLIQYLKTNGYAVVIATNPVYPAEAIRQRLLWGGLSGDFADYAFVTHAENMHFAKPDPAYYAEILTRIGVEPDEALMVGDNLDYDIHPAAHIGLHTFHIAPGDLQAFIAQVNTLESWATPAPTPTNIEAQLRGSMGALFGLLDHVQPHFWNQHPDPHEWSLLQIVCHLLEREDDVQRPRLERILAEDNPFIIDPGMPLGPRDFAPCDDDGFSAAHRFKATRQHTLQFITQINPEDWARPARHSIFGNTTLLEMALFTAQHDRLHLRQLDQTLAKCE